MCKNVGGADRILRALLGVIALIVAFAALGARNMELPGVLVGMAGIVLLMMAALGFCPAYLPFRVSTCRTSKS